MDRIKAMETFVKVAKLGSYTLAAHELLITPAMASKRITLLESELNVKLLYRNTHQLSLTGVGREYLQGCEKLLSEIRSLDNIIVDQEQSGRGEIKILCSKAFAESILAEVISEFIRSHSGITISLTIRDMSPKAEDILMEAFDLSIRTRAYSQLGDSNLIMRKIVPLERVLVASKTYISEKGNPLQPEDLKHHNCLNPNGNIKDTWHLSKGRTIRSVSVTGNLRANSGFVIRTACLRGLGIGLLSRYTVESFIDSGMLIPVLDKYEISPHALYVYYNKTHYLPVRTRAFIDFLNLWMRRRSSVSRRLERPRN